MKTNKIYKDALALIMTAGTDKALQNKWLKIEMNTEDKRLKYYAESLRLLYSLKLGSLKRSRVEAYNFEGTAIWSDRQTVPLINHKKQELRAYLEPIIASEQPQWEIIARQNGWSPPNSTFK